MNETIKNRIYKFCKYNGIHLSDLEKDIECSQGYLSKDLDTVLLKTLKSIKEKYPSLSLDWLITGEGDMLVSEQVEIKNLINSFSNNFNESEVINKLLDLYAGVLAKNKKLQEQQNLYIT